MLLSVFHFYYLGILRLAILLFRIFHRMAHTWKYGARTIQIVHAHQRERDRSRTTPTTGTTKTTLNPTATIQVRD
jgi:hypothetical protein